MDVFINPRDAVRRAIKAGDTVRVFNDRGTLERIAKISQRVPPGIIAMHQGPWFKPGADGIDHGGGVNTLTVDAIDRVGGSGTYNSILVEVKKA